MGFRVVSDRRSAAGDYLVVQRDAVRIGAATAIGHGDREHRQPPTGVEIVLEVDDLDVEVDRVRAAGWPLAEAVQTRPWGVRDFRVLDPSGYYVRVTDRTGQQPQA